MEGINSLELKEIYVLSKNESIFKINTDKILVMDFFYKIPIRINCFNISLKNNNFQNKVYFNNQKYLIIECIGKKQI